MHRAVYRVALVALAALAAAACDRLNNSSPTSTTTGGTASVTAPLATSPSANASVRFADQPVTLVVQNAALTHTSGTVYTFEVATDPAFAATVQTKGNVNEGPGGQTAVTLDALAGSKDYYWRARATGGGTTGPYSPAAHFTMGAAVILSPPTPIGPISNAQTSPRPAFIVTDSTHSGPAGMITYFFEVSTTSAFTSTIASGLVTESSGQTAFTPTSDLPTGTTLYWRATAKDSASNAQSTPSAVQTFSTRAFSAAETVATQQLRQTLWTGAYPPGTTGHATMGEAGPLGEGWNVQTLYYAPGNITFTCPDLEMLRFFDLFDRGFDPDSAINWMNSNGYGTAAQWYPPPEKAVLGLHTVYLAARGKVVTNGTWDIVLRVE